MSKNAVLYVKGMDLSESEDDEKMENNAWDDRKLIDSYDKALKIANLEVAKRIAMSTNTKGTPKAESSKSKKEKPVKPTSSLKTSTEWKAGMPCRSVYDEDGMEYEAFVLRIISDKECIVRYLGYENSEVVPINTLKPSLGAEARSRQIEQAVQEKPDDGFDSQSSHRDMETTDRGSGQESIDRRSFQKKKKSSKKNKNSAKNNTFDLPEMPMMPNISMLRNLGPMDMPMPPPPMAFMSSDRTDSEDQAISSMLLSWYMSGYYTGLYQGLKRAKESRRHV